MDFLQPAHIPTEIIQVILGFLSVGDILECYQINRQWHSATSSRSVWRRAVLLLSQEGILASYVQSYPVKQSYLSHMGMVSAYAKRYPGAPGSLHSFPISESLLTRWQECFTHIQVMRAPLCDLSNAHGHKLLEGIMPCLTNLRILDLRNNSGLTSLQSVTDNCPLLSELYLSGCAYLPSNTMLHIRRRLKMLSRLDISRTVMAAAALLDGFIRDRQETLTQLSLSYAPYVEEHGWIRLLHLLGGCPRLELLDISCNTAVSSRSIQAFASARAENNASKSPSIATPTDPCKVVVNVMHCEQLSWSDLNCARTICSFVANPKLMDESAESLRAYIGSLSTTNGPSPNVSA